MKPLSIKLFLAIAILSSACKKENTQSSSMTQQEWSQLQNFLDEGEQLAREFESYFPKKGYQFSPVYSAPKEGIPSISEAPLFFIEVLDSRELTSEELSHIKKKLKNKGHGEVLLLPPSSLSKPS
ncbi:hypothetical protein [Roseibacillus ishigakijimensis]|uniref:Lipoprotein n=1 Tax=Roseibacillus ishigakijimensis TaxID=454146 RepID=A0A934RPU1_9BACT|nr:hypothetical protein [Roseibacillus ishigakijimensis]MBK1834743.1 hypothetical protein [Roseibacillus ishigakijimensis]